MKTRTEVRQYKEFLESSILRVVKEIQGYDLGLNNRAMAQIKAYKCAIILLGWVLDNSKVPLPIPIKKNDPFYSELKPPVCANDCEVFRRSF